MDENHEIVKFGKKYVWGLQSGQTILMIKTIYENIEIYAEYEPIGTQSLKTEDIIEELDKIDKKLLKYVSCIVLSPLECPRNLQYQILSNSNDKIIAEVDSITKQVSVFARECNRAEAKEIISDHITIIHEIGHLIDSNFKINNKCFSENKNWIDAMEEDNKIDQMQKDLPKYYVSESSERANSNKEDFSDSFIFFTYERSKQWFAHTYPNRNKILEELWKRL